MEEEEDDVEPKSDEMCAGKKGGISGCERLGCFLEDNS